MAMKLSLGLALVFGFVTVGAAADAQIHWVNFVSAEHGFSVDMPAKVERRNPASSSPQWDLYSYEAEIEEPYTKFSIMVDVRRTRGIYDASVVDKFLEREVGTLVTKNAGKLLQSQPTTFQGQSAISYEMAYTDDGEDGVVRGITFMIDGGTMRLLMDHPKSEATAEHSFEHFTSSFKLIPMKYFAAEEAFRSPGGIRMVPPRGWIQLEGRAVGELVRFTNLDRVMTLAANPEPGYDCAHFEGDMRKQGGLQESQKMKLGEQQFLKLKGSRKVPKVNEPLTLIQYCQDGPGGAVILTGGTSERAFWRWEPVFEGVAASLRLK